jgi:hypothetical protein
MGIKEMKCEDVDWIHLVQDINETSCPIKGRTFFN